MMSMLIKEGQRFIRKRPALFSWGPHPEKPVTMVVEQFSCMPPPERVKNMTAALARGLPTIRYCPENSEWLNLVCYGPSLEQTWREIKHPIMTVSGAHDFLLARGIVPDYHVECDPRPHKSDNISKPHPDVQYLIALQKRQASRAEVLFGLGSVVKFYDLYYL